MKLDEFSKRDIVAMLELIHASTNCHDVEDFRKFFYNLEQLIHFEYSVCELAFMDHDGSVLFSHSVNISYPVEWLDIYLKDNWRRIDPIRQDVIKHSEARYWHDIFQSHTPPSSMFATSADFVIKSGYAHGPWNTQKNPEVYFISAAAECRGIRKQQPFWNI
jgi:hypothetical protein